MRVLGICGSLQASSGNLELLRTAARLAPDGVEVVISDALRHLPLFNPDIEADGVPAPVAAWRRELADCDAVLIACPEYAYSLPGALKNGIDWVVSSSELYRKVAAVTAAVPYAERGQKGRDALLQTLDAVDVVLVSTQPIVRGEDAEQELLALLQRVIAGVQAEASS
ncbi:NADPH-dependent FMN reductase [Haliangium ochraceum]|uniref:NADPH-dependent FMN reductase n=1 Tax=Haliangium ochraceum (strain DSM 14365 / JCM 11303 / SMP-2) TaxID=502025 RepID=D0LNU6_HALO1|nr:NADPH-dependent FMN reductase [Haliangium ochraceum]ACY18772.1 NADPH-dependent FMN reductase [Haliangium ochraceum DSM 14365]